MLDRGRPGIDAHEPDRVAAVFTEDAVFQGLRPYSVGRDGVRDYYESQPPGMTVTYRVLETRRPADDVVLGYVQADFAFADRTAVDAEPGRARSPAARTAGGSRSTRVAHARRLAAAPG